MSDTPRTDAEAAAEGSRFGTTVLNDCVGADFARQLERELTEAKELSHSRLLNLGKVTDERDQLRAALTVETRNKEDAQAEANQLRAEVERLSVHKMARRVDSQNHQESIKELSERCDQWREVAKLNCEALDYCVPTTDYGATRKIYALAAFERLEKEGK